MKSLIHYHQLLKSVRQKSFTLYTMFSRCAGIYCIVPLLLLIVVFSYSCQTKTRQTTSPETLFKGKNIPSEIKYATLFDVYKNNNVRKIVIHSPFNDTLSAGVFYLLDSTKYQQFKDFKNVLPFPLISIAALSSTQLNVISKLGLLNKVCGVSDQKYIQNKAVHKLIKSGRITEVSVAGQLFVEKAIQLNPQAIFFSPFQKGQTLPVLGNIKAIPYFDFMEDSPLGRAEWVKFTAAFIGGEHKADSVFEIIEKQYLKLKNSAASLQNRPTVFSGKYFNGQWFVPGGKSYMAQIFSDAGANYIWKDDSSRNSIALDFEIVLQKAQDANFWRILGGLPEENPYESLLKENPLYGHFNAFKKHHIVYCNPASTAYFETGTLEPQVILKDFIAAFHPELFSDYKPVYYHVLR